MKIQLNESSEAFKEILKEWKVEAEKVMPETFPEFFRKLSEDYSHDYGTIARAMGIVAYASAKAFDRTEQGGITGFQSGFVMWDFIKSWSYSSNKSGMRILDYDKMLFPQHSDHFEKTISENTWNLLKSEAKSKIDEHENELTQYELDIAQWNEEIEEFKKEYPDYDDRPDFYKKDIGIAIHEEHQKNQEKIDSGFVFAPKEPYKPSIHPDVYDHWVGITKGVVPFGYTVSSEN